MFQLNLIFSSLKVCGACHSVAFLPSPAVIFFFFAQQNTTRGEGQQPSNCAASEVLAKDILLFLMRARQKHVGLPLCIRS